MQASKLKLGCLENLCQKVISLFNSIYITLWPLNSTEHVFPVAPVSVWDILRSTWTCVLKANVSEAGKMGKPEDLSKFYRASLKTSFDSYFMGMAGCVCMPGLAFFSWLWKEGKLAEAGNFRLGNLGSFHWCRCYFDRYNIPKQCGRSCTPFNRNSIPWWMPPFTKQNSSGIVWEVQLV